MCCEPQGKPLLGSIPSPSLCLCHDPDIFVPGPPSLGVEGTCDLSSDFTRSLAYPVQQRLLTLLRSCQESELCIKGELSVCSIRLVIFSFSSSSSSSPFHLPHPHHLILLLLLLLLLLYLSISKIQAYTPKMKIVAIVPFLLLAVGVANAGNCKTKYGNDMGKYRTCQQTRLSNIIGGQRGGKTVKYKDLTDEARAKKRKSAEDKINNVSKMNIKNVLN
ncbi:hypothetical protein GQ42DRAFT_173566 [Ramicandelaber brevisporus]|nr:hypothetical protein GQ42DRAFT_173566 [Ramicandelaber brevisporus]